MTKDIQEHAPAEKFSQQVPVGRFILLSVATFGIYELVWFYRSWVLLKKEQNLQIYPFWRAFFSFLFAGSMARNLKQCLEKKHIQTTYSIPAIGISYFILSLTYRLPDPIWLISLFRLVPLIPLVRGINSYWEKEEPNLQIKPFKWWQIILIILGMLWVISAIIGSFIPQ